MSQIYLGGPCDSEHRTLMVRAAEALRSMGHNVYCPFELKIENAWDYSQEDWAQMVFKADISAMNHCDYAIVISLGRISSAGTNWECGYFYACGIPVYVLQVNDSPTSLMTFCGADYFVSTTEVDLVNELEVFVPLIENQAINSYKKECVTVLT
jgi:nucleoside 2-deoxyribosyltransferase